MCLKTSSDTRGKNTTCSEILCNLPDSCRRFCGSLDKFGIATLPKKSYPTTTTYQSGKDNDVFSEYSYDVTRVDTYIDVLVRKCFPDLL